LKRVSRFHNRHAGALDEGGEGADVGLGVGQVLVADGVVLRAVEVVAVVGHEGEGFDVLGRVLDPGLDVEVVLEGGDGRVGANRHAHDVAEVVEGVAVR